MAIEVAVIAVLIEPTEVFKNELQRLSRQGGRLERDLEERAAVETGPAASSQRTTSSGERGRNPPVADLWSRHDPAIRDAVRSAIERAHSRNAKG